MKSIFLPRNFFSLRIISCILIICAVYYGFSLYEQAAASKAVQPMTTTNKFKNYDPILPAAPLRNPFLANRTAKYALAQEKTSLPALPVLLGIIAQGNKRAGIFDYAGQSSYHTVGDKIGPYTIKAITQNSAILIDAQQQISLKVEG